MASLRRRSRLYTLLGACVVWRSYSSGNALSIKMEPAAREFPIDEIRYERPNLCGVVARPDYEPLETDNRTVEEGRSVIAPSPDKNIGSIVVCLTLSIGNIKEFIEKARRRSPFYEQSSRNRSPCDAM